MRRWPYLLISVGVSRESCEEVRDEVRRTVFEVIIYGLSDEPPTATEAVGVEKGKGGIEPKGETVDGEVSVSAALQVSLQPQDLVNEYMLQWKKIWKKFEATARAPWRHLGRLEEKILWAPCAA